MDVQMKECTFKQIKTEWKEVQMHGRTTKKHEIDRSKWNYPEGWKLNEKRKRIKGIYSCLTLKVQTNQVVLLNVSQLARPYRITMNLNTWTEVKTEVHTIKAPIENEWFQQEPSFSAVHRLCPTTVTGRSETDKERITLSVCTCMTRQYWKHNQKKPDTLPQLFHDN